MLQYADCYVDVLTICTQSLYLLHLPNETTRSDLHPLARRQHTVPHGRKSNMSFCDAWDCSILTCIAWLSAMTLLVYFQSSAGPILHEIPQLQSQSSTPVMDGPRRLESHPCKGAGTWNFGVLELLNERPCESATPCLCSTC